jgi:hypothetical protein
MPARPAGESSSTNRTRRPSASGFDTGSAYVYVRSGSAWTPQAKLTALDGGGLDFFGESVWR